MKVTRGIERHPGIMQVLPISEAHFVDRIQLF